MTTLLKILTRKKGTKVKRRKKNEGLGLAFFGVVSF